MIKFTFPDLDEEIEVDQYRVFWISESFNNNYIIFAAYLNTEDDFEAQMGRTLMIWVGDELAKPGQTL